MAFVLCTAAYWPGLSGAFLFDDYPNIVDNHGLQIADASVSNLARAALSSPSSEFKRPLASLSFAANYLVTGLAPFTWKLTNLAIHLLNGWMVYLLSLALLRATAESTGAKPSNRAGLLAVLIAAGWMLLPINLTAVLYIVQRMESLANLFVLIGLLGYVAGRRCMMAGRRGIWLCIASVLLPTAIGLLAKETAVMLPLYAFLVEWIVFQFARVSNAQEPARHRGLLLLFVLVLLLPMLSGLAWLVPGLLRPSAWATRDFTLGTRLLSEARIVTDYIGWTLLPTPGALSFYHDDFRISTGLLKPWTTLASIGFLAAFIFGTWILRHRNRLASLGLAFYLACHLLTGTILPLELIYEHRNYFASFGLLLALVPLLAAPRMSLGKPAEPGSPDNVAFDRPLPLSMPRYVLLAGLMLLWTGETAMTAIAWGNPLSLAQELAARAPESPRAQYELGRTYIIYSHYDPNSFFTDQAYAPLERAMQLPDSSILPEQALIFMNARLHRPFRDEWWDSLVEKLASRKPGVQDESSLGSLTKCQIERLCALPKELMINAFQAALSHPRPSARLLATYGDYAWNVLDDRELGEQMAAAAVEAQPMEPAYHITLVHMLVAQGKKLQATEQLRSLKRLNIGGRLSEDIQRLRKLIGSIPEPSRVRTSSAQAEP
ncbi:hypothetical protein J7I44_10240 [Frateuria sp. MAH-13]|uniref:Uncharacterized protein n=1 Tax=Frateuria flava TaxID=2821489 RepID=A0ABS4DNP1_9GAMM|nr:hypothetical protein [Frateuria flava]MBP1474679.1 hypothetical protein [Frateuria flava]